MRRYLPQDGQQRAAMGARYAPSPRTFFLLLQEARARLLLVLIAPSAAAVHHPFTKQFQLILSAL